MHTPWGASDSEHPIADGLIRVSTGRHGGLWLDATRWQTLTTMFPSFQSCTGPGWLEEDCDWAVVPLAWPELFSPEEVFNALRCARDRRDRAVSAAWLSSPPGERVQAIAAAFESSICDAWEVGALWGPVKGAPEGAWGVTLLRGTERQAVVFRNYPTQQFYHDAALTPLTIPRRASTPAVTG